MKELLLRGHLGLGDHLICNAIVRHLAKKHQLCVLVKHHNSASVNFMFRDLVNVETFGVSDDKEADQVVKHVEGLGYDIMTLGMFGAPPYSHDTFDKCFYQQAGMPFQDSWNYFHVKRQPSKELPVPKRDYVFVHEDKQRGFLIPKTKLPKRYRKIYADPSKSDNIFNWWGIIENAKEIHCIDSAFAILTDRLPERKASRIAIHDYARKGHPPVFMNDWERLK